MLGGWLIKKWGSKINAKGGGWFVIIVILRSSCPILLLFVNMHNPHGLLTFPPPHILDHVGPWWTMLDHVGAAPGTPKSMILALFETGGASPKRQNPWFSPNPAPAPAIPAPPMGHLGPHGRAGMAGAGPVFGENHRFSRFGETPSNYIYIYI